MVPALNMAKLKRWVLLSCLHCNKHLPLAKHTLVIAAARSGTDAGCQPSHLGRQNFSDCAIARCSRLRHLVYSGSKLRN